MQDTPNFDKPLPLDSFVLHRKFRSGQLSYKLKSVLHGPFKLIIQPTDVTYEFLTQDGKHVLQTRSIDSIFS